MNARPAQLSLDQWERRYRELRADGLCETSYGGPLERHVRDGDTRLRTLRYDNSPAALRLWNFLLTEERRLHRARESGQTIVGAMKDLGTVPLLCYALPETVAFYPDGAWWIPCVMELQAGLLDIADRLGVNEAFCPVRAMLGAFVSEAHFPRPDLLVCSVGAVCDDFSAIAQRLEGLGHPILWWEMPHRREADPDESAVELPGGYCAPVMLVEVVRKELKRVGGAIEELTGQELTPQRLMASIRAANEFRATLRELRMLAYSVDPCPMGALELLIAEMLALHYCSDRAEAQAVLCELLDEVRRRVRLGLGVLSSQAARIYWVNPVADLRAMNVLETCGGRVCGTDYMFSHSLEPIPTLPDPLEALARVALADPMVGSSEARAKQISRDIVALGSEAVVISRIPGASHCAIESDLLGHWIQTHLNLPVVQIEVPPLIDSALPSLQTRLEALVELVMQNRNAKEDQ